MASPSCHMRNIIGSCLFLLIISSYLLPYSDAQNDQDNTRKRKPYKFMRWGRGYFDSEDLMTEETIDTSIGELPSKLQIPLFGDDSVLCLNLNENGLYQCFIYNTDSATLRH